MVCLGCGSGGRTGLEPPSSAVELELKAGLPRIAGSSGSSTIGTAAAVACAVGGRVGDGMVTMKQRRQSMVRVRIEDNSNS